MFVYIKSSFLPFLSQLKSPSANYKLLHYSTTYHHRFITMSYLLVSTTIPHSLSSINNNPLQRTTQTRRPPQVRGSVGVSHISCIKKQTNPNERTPDQNTTIYLDRRNVLVGLGGLYGATTATQAIGAPIEPPVLADCHIATNEADKTPVECCPPYAHSSPKIIDFVQPAWNEPLRVRKPAHKYPAEELAKFEAAITKMRQLPDDDPWNYWQQAKIHCTFCNNAFNQAGSASPLQVHFSWIFLPWHRCYLYFWEKILGKLIDDPTFTVPFWNYDTKQGMKLPEIYWRNKDSPLYDSNRNETHYDTMVNYYNGDPFKTVPQNPDEVAYNNYIRLHKDFTEGELLPSLFMGGPLRAGQATSQDSIGSCENVHNTIHSWVGRPAKPFHDLGNFVTSAKDPVFWGIHGNVDRMWDIFTQFRYNKPGFREADWRESAFIFVDENRDIVKIKVKDCLKPEQLRYTYSNEYLPWMDMSRKFKSFKKEAKKRSAGDSLKLIPVSEFGSTPRSLKEAIRALVPRPKTSRNKEEKEAALEVLVIDDIVTPSGEPVKFDIYVAKTIEGLVGPDFGDLADSITLVPHSHGHGGARKKNFETGITLFLEDIDAEGSKNLVVTLVPRYGDVTVGGIHIELREVDDGLVTGEE